MNWEKFADRHCWHAVGVLIVAVAWFCWVLLTGG